MEIDLDTGLTRGTVTEDAFLDGQVMAYQPADGLRAGMEAVFLAASVPAKPGETILELGTGTGIAGLCLCARVPGCRITGLELQGILCDLARANALRNGHDRNFEIIEADILAMSKTADKELPPESFNHVFANPPFYDADRVRMPPNRAKARAHACTPGQLEAWIKLMIRLAAPRATVTLIATPDRLGEILKAFGPRIGGVIAAPLHAASDTPATRIIIQGVKGSKAPLVLNHGFVLHRSGGGFRKPARDILRNAAPFQLR